MASIMNRDGRWRAQVRIRGHHLCQTFDTETQAATWATEEEGRIRTLLVDATPDPAMKATKYQVSGVYLLLRGREVRYIGRSVHIYRRLSDHDRKAMEWDSFRIWPCSNWMRAAELEMKLIRKYQPVLNVALTDAAKTAGTRVGRKKADIFTRYRPVSRMDDDTWQEAVA